MRIHCCCLLSILELLYNFLCGPLMYKSCMVPWALVKWSTTAKKQTNLKPLVCWATTWEPTLHYIYFSFLHNSLIIRLYAKVCVWTENWEKGVSGTNCLCMCKVPLITYILLHIHWKFTCGSAPCGFQVRSDNVLMLQLNTLHCIIFEAISKLQWERLCHSVVFACNRQLHRIPARNS